MSDDTDRVSKAWKSATMLLGLGFLFAASWGYSQAQRANKLEEQLQQARADVTDLSQRAQEEIAKLAKRDLPVSVGFREALLGSGLVAIIENHSGKPLEVAAEFSSDKTGDRKRVSLVIPANGQVNYGHTEGWAFASGQKIKLTNSDYREATYSAP